MLTKIVFSPYPRDGIASKTCMGAKNARRQQKPCLTKSKLETWDIQAVLGSHSSLEDTELTPKLNGSRSKWHMLKKSPKLPNTNPTYHATLNHVTTTIGVPSSMRKHDATSEDIAAMSMISG